MCGFHESVSVLLSPRSTEYIWVHTFFGMTQCLSFCLLTPPQPISKSKNQDVTEVLTFSSNS